MSRSTSVIWYLSHTVCRGFLMHNTCLFPRISQYHTSLNNGLWQLAWTPVVEPFVCMWDITRRCFFTHFKLCLATATRWKLLITHICLFEPHFISNPCSQHVALNQCCPNAGSPSTTLTQPKLAELNNLIFHPLEVMSRYRDLQLQVGDNYSYKNCLIWDQTFANPDV